MVSACCGVGKSESLTLPRCVNLQDLAYVVDFNRCCRPQDSHDGVHFIKCQHHGCHRNGHEKSKYKPVVQLQSARRAGAGAQCCGYGQHCAQHCMTVVVSDGPLRRLAILRLQ
jgi:hypothetical protein